MTINLGIRLAHIRKIHGLSQRELAKRAGITNSTISLIESNSTNPSVGALKRILDAIPISLGEFFSLDLQDGEKIFYRSAELSEIGKGDVSYRQVGRHLNGRTLQILVECYQIGADTGRIPLSHDAEEGGVVVSGRIEVTVDGQRQILTPGDAYYFDSRRPHRFRCVGTEPCRIISASTPPCF